MKSPRREADRKISEKEFQSQIIQLAKMLGWWVYHTYNSMRSQEGFPDLVLIRERVIFAELKAGKNKPTVAQTYVLGLLNGAKQEAYLWYPSDWDQIVATLTRRGG